MIKELKTDKMAKKCFGVCAVFLAIIIMVLFLFYENQVKRVAVQPRSVLSVESYEHFPDSNAGMIELYADTTFQQTLIMVSVEFDGLSIWVDNKDEKSKGMLEIVLKKEGHQQIIQSWSYDITQFPYQGFINLFLNEPEKTEVGERYILEISSKDTQDTAIKFQQVRGEDMAGVFSINENKQEGISLSYRINEGSCHALIYFFAIVSFIVVMGIIVTSILIIKKIKIEKIAFCLVIILGSLYIMVIPPYATPDEPAHISTAYAQSSMLMNKDAIDSEGRVVGYDDMTSYLVRREIPNANSYVQYIRWLLGKNESITESKNFVLGSYLDMGGVGYIPQIVGITIGRIAKLNSIQILFVGRLCAMFLFAVITYLTVKLMPFGKITMLVIAILPMTMQQAVSFSYDSVLNGVLFFMIAYSLYLAYSKERVHWKQILIIIGLNMVVIPTKFIYIAIVALCLLIPKEKFGGRRNKIVAGSTVALGSIVIIIATNIERIFELIATTEKHKGGASSELAYYTASYVLKHPLQTIEVFVNTITRDISYYVETLIGQHLGWLDIGIESIIILGFIILLLLSVLQKEKELRIGASEKYVMAGVIVVVFIMVLFSLLMAETYVGSETVLGVQGRYFLPVLPLILFLMQNKRIVLKENITSFIICGGLFLNISTVINIMGVLLNR